MKFCLVLLARLRIPFWCLVVGATLFIAAQALATIPDEATLKQSINAWVNPLAAQKPLRLVVIEKEFQHVLVLELNGQLKAIAEYPCATGATLGRKEVSGDSKTPEGIYFIDKSYKDNKITIFGNQAFHLDYPNSFDTAAGRNGDGIYIHGTNRELRPNSTNGCITMKNEDLEALSAFLQLEVTPVLIVPSIKKVLSVAPARNANIRKEVIKPLLLPDDADDTKVEFNYLYLLSDGQQRVAVGEYSEMGGKPSTNGNFSRVYLEPDAKHYWSIKERVCGARPLQTPPPTSMAQFSLTPEASPRDKQKVLDFVEKWRTAWAAKHLDAYINAYDPSFRQGNMNRTAWRRYKEDLNKKYKFISVTLSDITVSWTDTGAAVAFYQVYKSDKFTSQGRKILHMAQNGQSWAIKSEQWIKPRSKPSTGQK